MQQASPTDEPRKRGRPKGSTGNTQHLVQNANGLYFINTGSFYKAGCNRPIVLEGPNKNLIDLGDYSGVVPPAYGTEITGAYIADPDHDRSEIPRLEYDRRRRVDDIIAFTLYGPPPEGWGCSWAVHADGDQGNNKPSNIAGWASYGDPDRDTRQLMMSEEAVLARFNTESRGGIYMPQLKALKRNMPDVFVGERMDAPMRHRMVQYPPNVVAGKWNPDFESDRREAQDKLKAS